MNRIALLSLVALSLVLSTGCGSEPPPDEDSVDTDGPTDTVSSAFVGVMRYGNCTPTEEAKLNAAVQVLVGITGTQYSSGAGYAAYQSCLSSARFVENGWWSGAQIANQIRM